jgi:predicted nucleotidyltransferase
MNTASNSTIVNGAIDEMVRRIVRQFQPDRIILFGSRARSNDVPDSDVDLMIVMPITRTKAQLEIEIGVALHDIRVPKDIVVVSPQEYERYRDVVGTLVHPASREGKILYARS